MLQHCVHRGQLHTHVRKISPGPKSPCGKGQGSDQIMALSAHLQNRDPKTTNRAPGTPGGQGGERGADALSPHHFTNENRVTGTPADPAASQVKL